MHVILSNFRRSPLLLVIRDKLNIYNMQKTLKINNVCLIFKREYLSDRIHLYTRRARHLYYQSTLYSQSHLSWKMDVFHLDLLLFSILMQPKSLLVLAVNMNVGLCLANLFSLA